MKNEKKWFCQPFGAGQAYLFDFGECVCEVVKVVQKSV